MGFGGLVLSICAIAIVSFPGQSSAQKRSQKPKFKESIVGVIPTEFGEVVAISSDQEKTTMVFRDSANVLRIISLRGNRLPPVLQRIDREY